jgi:hypothetical protein
VWAFQPSGKLMLVGPGDLEAEGTWAPYADHDRAFHASVDIEASSQVLTIIGAAAGDGRTIAMFVAASEPDDRGLVHPWPAGSVLFAGRFGLTVE